MDIYPTTLDRRTSAENQHIANSVGRAEWAANFRWTTLPSQRKHPRDILPTLLSQRTTQRKTYLRWCRFRGLTSGNISSLPSSQRILHWKYVSTGVVPRNVQRKYISSIVGSADSSLEIYFQYRCFCRFFTGNIFPLVLFRGNMFPLVSFRGMSSGNIFPVSLFPRNIQRKYISAGVVPRMVQQKYISTGIPSTDSQTEMYLSWHHCCEFHTN